jgi:hypothetical protein
MIFGGMEMTVSPCRMHVAESFPANGTKFATNRLPQPVVREQRRRLALLSGFAALQETVLLSLLVAK